MSMEGAFLWQKTERLQPRSKCSMHMVQCLQITSNSHPEYLGSSGVGKRPSSGQVQMWRPVSGDGCPRLFEHGENVWHMRLCHFAQKVQGQVKPGRCDPLDRVVTAALEVLSGSFEFGNHGVGQLKRYEEPHTRGTPYGLSGYQR